MNLKKTILSVLGVSILSTTSTIAVDFADGIDKLRQSVEFRKKAIDVEKYLEPLESYTDERGNDYLFFTKNHEGIPVYGEKKVVVLEAGGFSPMYLNPLQSLSADEITFMENHESREYETNIGLEEAFTIAIKDMRQSKAILHEALPSHLAKAGQKFLYRDGDDYKQVWHVVLPGLYDGLKSSFDYFINTEDGSVVDKVRNIYDIDGSGYDLTEGTLHTFPVEEEDGKKILKDSGRKLNVYNSSQGKFSADDDGVWEDEGETRKENQRAEVELYLNMARTIDYFKDTHNFTWKNGSADVQATAHVRTNFNNAYYSSWQGGFFFGDGSGDAKGFDYLTKGLDVAAHEFTHGVINVLSPLTYSGESGALNEHIADFFGAMVDADEWQMGDNITIGDNPALRNMKDPTRGKGNLITEGMSYNDWVKMHKDNNILWRLYPDRVSKKILANGWGQDNGGVHINSSIFNKFAYLATTGEEIGEEGLGRDLMSSLYMRLMRSKTLSSRESFQGFRDKFMANAEIHLADHEAKDQHLNTLTKAFAAIDL